VNTSEIVGIACAGSALGGAGIGGYAVARVMSAVERGCTIEWGIRIKPPVPVKAGTVPAAAELHGGAAGDGAAALNGLPAETAFGSFPSTPLAAAS
jgi:hypothetical protein